MEQRTDAPTFNCEECGSVSIAVEAPLTEASAVRCCGCRAYLGPWCLFLDELHWRLACLGASHVRQHAASRAKGPN